MKAISMKRFLTILLLICGLISSCRDVEKFKEKSDALALFPDYTHITLPPNIAPLNFRIQEPADKYLVILYDNSGNKIQVNSRNGEVKFPLKRWKSLLNQNKGKVITMDFFLKQHGNWIKYKSITNSVAEEAIDPCLVYRLIEPGYETWNKMGIYQRNLESFEETPVVLNEMSDGNCMNCHSFCKNSNDTMLFHMRAQNGGTYFYKSGKLTKVETKTDSTLSAGVYPSWHPGGRFLAFSVNRIVQSFHAIPGRKVEVIDTLSDLIIYDLKYNKVLSNNRIASGQSYETFPAWSPDGKYLYYCNAGIQSYKDFENIRYDLFKIAFDTSRLTFGKADTVIAAARNGYSVSFPRISPDGKLLMFCKTRYGNFTIWHDDSDIYAMNLVTSEIYKPGINSNRSESYHTWSSSGRWMVFSSRRIDGLYTRPYFTYIDSTGKAHKPFLLPQKDPDFYMDLNKSYNVPELVKSKIDINPQKLQKIIKSTPEQAKFERVF